MLDAGASSGKDKAMQTELFEVDPLSDNRKLYARAAEALDYSQSAVTVQIQQLERELGVQLFDRIGKTVSITQYGKIGRAHV